MYTFKDGKVNDLTDEERFDLITDGYLREPIYDFGTELVTEDADVDVIYECEYLTKEKTLKSARMLWCINRKTQEFTKLPEDPVLEGHDDSNRSEHYLELKARIAEGDYPDMSELESPEEFQLILPKLMESGIIQFDRDSGEYKVPDAIQAELDRMTKD